ncbi:unnamed protein product [Amoebophrya sp. A120]|nr:unnamed protein product [Amoebophrya sp. A120]|eukprot:GSA120T00005799001.1
MGKLQEDSPENSPRSPAAARRRSSFQVVPALVEPARVLVEYFCGAIFFLLLPFCLVCYAFSFVLDNTLLFLFLWCVVLFGSVYIFMTLFDKLLDSKQKHATQHVRDEVAKSKGTTASGKLTEGTNNTTNSVSGREGAVHIAPHGQLEPFPVGARLRMGFRRAEFVWTAKHIAGKELRKWEYVTDEQGDKLFHEQPSLTSDEFIERIKPFAELPDWVDHELLNAGCTFYRSLWPLISYQFSWAVVGGFGAEAASAVLLKTRYWADKGPTGKIDTWNRLRETLCFLYDLCGHGASGFDVDGPAWRSCLLVRFLHARTREGVWRQDRAIDVDHDDVLLHNQQQHAANNANVIPASGSSAFTTATERDSQDHEERDDSDNSEDGQHPDGEHNVINRTPSKDSDSPQSSPKKRWDREKFGDPINQAELIGTLLGCSALLLDGMEEMSFGAKIPKHQREGFLHLWRLVGFLFGIKEEWNPNRNSEHAKIVMQSLYTFGIPAHPDPKLSAVLANHIMDSVAEGVNQDLLKKSMPGFVSSSMVATTGWLFLGDEYATALDLPKLSRKDRIYGSLRKWSLGLCLFAYFRFIALWELFRVTLVVEYAMHLLFKSACKQVWNTQPKCRFAKSLCPFENLVPGGRKSTRKSEMGKQKTA